jgi:hypothetical protein
MRTLKTIALVALICIATGAQAQEKWVKGLPGQIDLDVMQLFSIHTSGFQAANPDDILSEFGTGFAIAPDVVITAGHVTRDRLHFANRAGDDKIHIPDREVELTFAVGKDRRADIEDTLDVIVTPSPLANTDAASLTLYTRTVNPLPLSVCDITRGRDYYLLKFSQSGSAKKKNVPVAVKVRPSDDVAARLGNLMRFEHQIVASDHEARPVGGDSGSPVLDENGHVVGLLTAVQGSSYLWVTPTLSFFDLVPPEVKQTVSCKDNIEVTNVELAKTNGAVDLLVAQMATMVAQIETLQDAVAQLNAKDISLDEIDETLKQDIDQTSQRSTAVLAAMVLRSQDRGEVTEAALLKAMKQINEIDPNITVELVTKAIEQMKTANPVFPAVTRIDQEFKRVTKDLGVPKWSFEHIVGTPHQPKQPLFSISYKRTISRPVIAESLVLCMRPMFEFAEGVNVRGPNRDFDIRNTNFYYVSEDIFEDNERFITECAPKAGPSPSGIPITKNASYNFTMDLDKTTAKERFPDLIIPDAPTRYYAYIYDERAFKKQQWDEAILHRFIFEVDRSGEVPKFDCFTFSERDSRNPDRVEQGKTLDKMAEFVGRFSDEEKEKFRCETSNL